MGFVWVKKRLLFFVLLLFFSGLRFFVFSPASTSNTGSAFTGRAVLAYNNETLPTALETNTNNDNVTNSDPGQFQTSMDDITATCGSTFDSHGGIVVYLFGIMYMFIGLAVLCEGEFKDSLVGISKAMKLSQDVAGATFMAAGTSSPELFTALVASFGPIDDIGVGTIVGSVIFNILIIVGATAVFSGGFIFDIDWKPVSRDTIVNAVSFTFLFGVFWDGYVFWYEALIGVFLYIVYVAMMCINVHMMYGMDKLATKIKKVFCAKCKKARKPNRPEPGDDNSLLDDSDMLFADDEEYGDPISHITLARTNSMVDATELVGVETLPGPPEPAKSEWDDEPEKYHGPPRTPLMWLWHVIASPYEILFRYTIPPAKGRFKYQFVLTFIMALFWLATMTVAMVKWTEKVGCILHIDDAIMGLTFLAVGTSVPDCLTSIFVGRDGHGTMAVCNALGSNIFDILIALCLPWMLAILLHDRGTGIRVYSESLIRDTGFLFGTISIFYLSMMVMRWRLDKRLGFFLIFLYFVFVVYSVLSQMGVIPF